MPPTHERLQLHHCSKGRGSVGLSGLGVPTGRANGLYQAWEPDVRGHDCPVDVTRTPPDRYSRIIRSSQVHDLIDKILDKLKAHPGFFKATAFFITFDEGGGYWDSGFFQPIDFFGERQSPPFPFHPGGRGEIARRACNC